jgi:hypothetical protein
VSLAQAYLVLAAILLLSGWLVYFNAPILKSFRRDKFATMILLIAAVGWFGFQLYHLPEPDLAGLPRDIVLGVFVVAGLLTYFTMPDFLSVRALGVLMLFTARLTLDAGYRQLPYSLLDASISYVFLIILGLWWAVSPVAFNKQCDWVLENPSRHKTIGTIFFLTSLVCLIQIKFIP